MPYIIMDYVAMPYISMDYIVMVYIAMAYIVMVYGAMVYIVMASQVFTEGFSDADHSNSMYALYVGVCFSAKVTVTWQRGAITICAITI